VLLSLLDAPKSHDEWIIFSNNLLVKNFVLLFIFLRVFILLIASSAEHNGRGHCISLQMIVGVEDW